MSASQPIDHPALAPGRVAVITGAANGIGLAVAQRLAAAGMRICLADIGDGLAQAERLVRRHGAPDTLTVTVDVADARMMAALSATVFARFGDVGLLMNNAAVGGGGVTALANPESWESVIRTNFFGVLNGLQSFGQRMIDQGSPAVIVNTGSKQGITAPPGDSAYNVSKAAIKMVTEELARSLRDLPECQVTAHLLIPGFTYTSMIARHVKEKPEGAWNSEQVSDALILGLLAGDFYVLCPDNETSRETDIKRILWSAGDIVENRPALSRWHPDFEAAFVRYMAE